MMDLLRISGTDGTQSVPQIILSSLTQSVIIPAVVFTVLFTVDFVGSKTSRRVYNALLVIAALGAAAAVTFFSPVSGSAIISELALAFVMTAVVFILNFFRLSAVDYAVMFACFACISRFTSTLFGISLSFLSIFIVLLVICRIRLTKLNGQLFHIWFAFMLSAVEGWVFSALFNGCVINMGYSFKSNIEKLVVWGAATALIIALNFAIIYAIKRLFGKYFEEINRMGKAYPKVERFFIYNSVGILLLMMFMHFGYQLANGFGNMPAGAFTFFLIFALVIQLSFLIMIFRITWLKENLHSKEMESQSLAAYSSSLERNMDDIRNIKHDIKNIFLTMGNFVEQSGYADMQAFYREKIAPFASGEIAKSDMYGKLSAINSEPLKAFLYYKISQAVERGVPVDLDITPHFLALEISMEVTDLVRVLGILMDNAIEECLALPRRIITVKLAQNDEIASLAIKNTVSLEKKTAGIKAGVSSKGDDRGKGLVIVKRTLEKYDCVTLNSYFQEDCFVQNIVAYRHE